MEKRPTVLFVTFEGLADTVIDSQVLTHARMMKNLGVAEFEIWVFACQEDMYQQSLAKQAVAEKLAEAPVRVFRGLQPARPFSVSANARRLMAALTQQGRRFTHIHARTDYSTLVCEKAARHMGAVLIWDCRGDTVAEVDYRISDGSVLGRLAAAFRKFYLRHRVARAAQICDRAIFVSTALKEMMDNKMGVKPRVVLPCSASADIFYVDTEKRNAVRGELGITDARPLYVYSGSLTSYQRFDDTVALFARIRTREPSAAFLVLTPDQETARRKTKDLPPESVFLRSATLTEMNGYLNAADAAFMLRDRTPTNRVASPTKFAEYCLTGLPVIMTDAVLGAFDLARRNGNLMAVSDREDPGPIPTLDRTKIMNSYLSLLSRKGQADAYRRCYGPLA